MLEKQASQQSTKKRNDIPTSLTPKELRSADTPLSMGNPSGMPLLNGILILMTIIVAARVLVKIEGGAKIARKDKIANILNQPKNGKIAKVSHTQNITALRSICCFFQNSMTHYTTYSITNKPIKPI